MADEFDARTSWWSTAARAATSATTATSFDGSAASYSPSIPDNAGSAVQQSAPGTSLIDSSSFGGGAMDWNQSLLSSSRSSSSSTAGSLHALLQESLNYPPPIDSGHHQAHHHHQLQLGSHNFLLDDHHQHQHQQQQAQPAAGFTTMLQGLFEPEGKPQMSMFDHWQQPSNYFPQFLKSSPTKQQNMQFSNNTAFWNASAGGVSEARPSGFYPPPAVSVQFGSSAAAPSYVQKPSCSGITTKTKSNSEKRSGSGGETAAKKQRVETLSPLPTFKVRKEKLGDRITALQQLVSPFGKTDTASVLHEAIEYIKFLHDQVSVLSTPYMKNGHAMQQQQSSSEPGKDGGEPRQDLRSRGLCLVPIESTYPVASETTADFWTPTFGGSYR